jgi:hypothetical protein
LSAIPIVVDLLLLFNVVYLSSGRATAQACQGYFNVSNYHTTRNFSDLAA